MLPGAQNDSHNLKYLGIDALGRLIKISAEIAEQHQLAVIDCLEVRNVTSQVSSKQRIAITMLAFLSVYVGNT